MQKKAGPPAIVLRKGLAVTWIKTAVAALIGLVTKRNPFFIVTMSLGTLCLGGFHHCYNQSKKNQNDTFLKESTLVLLTNCEKGWEIFFLNISGGSWSQRIKYLEISPKEKAKAQNDSNLSFQSDLAQIAIHKIYIQRYPFFDQNQQTGCEGKIDKCNSIETASQAHAITRINKKRIAITHRSKQKVLASIERIPPISSKHISIMRSNG